MARATKTLMAGILISLIVVFNSIALSSDTHRSFYQVQNLSCGYCLGKIDSKLRELDGYIGLTANFEKELIAVDHRNDLDETEIANALKSIGYPARVCEYGTARYQTLKSESMRWKKPSNGILNRILNFIIR